MEFWEISHTRHEHSMISNVLTIIQRFTPISVWWNHLTSSSAKRDSFDEVRPLDKKWRNQTVKKEMVNYMEVLGTTFSTPKVVPNTTSLFFYMDYVWTIIQISSTFQLKKWWLPLIWHVRRIYHLASDGKSNFGSSSIRDMNIPYYQMSQPSSKGFNLSPFDDNNWLHHLQNVILLMKSDR